MGEVRIELPQVVWGNHARWRLARLQSEFQKALGADSVDSEWRGAFRTYVHGKTNLRAQGTIGRNELTRIDSTSLAISYRGRQKNLRI